MPNNFKAKLHNYVKCTSLKNWNLSLPTVTCRMRAKKNIEKKYCTRVLVTLPWFWKLSILKCSEFDNLPIILFCAILILITYYKFFLTTQIHKWYHI